MTLKYEIDYKIILKKFFLPLLIGLILYAGGGVISITVVRRVSIRPVIMVLAVFPVIYGPLSGFIAGALGHILADIFLGSDIGLNWALGSGILGASLGFLYFPMVKKRQDEGVFGIRDALLYISLLTPGCVGGYGISGILDIIKGTEELDWIIYRTTLIIGINILIAMIVGPLCLYFITRLRVRRWPVIKDFWK